VRRGVQGHYLPQLEEGFVVDYAAGGNRKVAEWAQGEPKGSFWHGVDLSSASQIPIVTYRCAARVGISSSMLEAKSLD